MAGLRAWLANLFGLSPVPEGTCWKCRKSGYAWQTVRVEFWRGGSLGEADMLVEMCPRCGDMGRMKPLPTPEPSAQWRAVGAPWGGS